MGLESLISLFQEKGLARQALLLQSRRRSKYLAVLLQPQWETEVSLAVGIHLYKEMCVSEVGKRQRLLSLIFEKEESFRAMEYSLPSLEISLSHTFNQKVLEKTAEMAKEINNLNAESLSLVYGEAHKQLSNDKLIYDVYKDRDIIPEEKNNLDKSKLFDFYSSTLSKSIERGKRLIDLNGPEVILQNELNLLYELVEPEKYIFLDESKEIDLSLDLAPYSLEQHQEMLNLGKKILQEPKLQKEYFLKWLENQKNSKRRRVIKDGEQELSLFSQKIDYLNLKEMEVFSPVSLEYFLKDKMYSLNGQMLDEKSALSILFHQPLENRQNFLNYFQTEMDNCNRHLIGLEQILSGGSITNPLAHPQSIVQNHALFPNLKYSTETLEELQKIVPKMKLLLEELPDISDLATPTKLRKKRDLTYMMTELPKNPLDVTFGNDSGCCIFVPENLDELENGQFVPDYLLEKNIRLFALYRTEGRTEGCTESKGNANVKKQRMGLVVAFETQSENGEVILACNSLELSRRGLAGGRETTKKVVGYAENWLIGYAQKAGYSGVAMGSHSYNTSINHSAHIGEMVEETLTYLHPKARFYSDIFQLSESNKSLHTRPDSCYWLWRKE